jgi:hypothetical protein
MPRTIRASALAFLFLAAACGGAQSQVTPAPADTSTASAADPRTNQLIPAGFGRLNQDDISLRLVAGDMEIRFVPLEERVIRILAPDAYRALRDIRESRRAGIDSVARRYGAAAPGVALVTFFSARTGQRFEPQSIYLSVLNQEFRAIGMVPISANFTSQQLQVRGQANAIYVFDIPIPVMQEFIMGYGTFQTDGWKGRVPIIEREFDRISTKVRASQNDTTSTRP